MSPMQNTQYVSENSSMSERKPNLQKYIPQNSDKRITRKKTPHVFKYESCLQRANMLKISKAQ